MENGECFVHVNMKMMHEQKPSRWFSDRYMKGKNDVKEGRDVGCEKPKAHPVDEQIRHSPDHCFMNYVI